MCGTNNMNKKQLSPDAVINLDHGDPTMFEEYWQKMGEKCTLTISGYKSLSYFSDPNNICWFMEAELGEEIRRLHDVVGNVVTDNRHIIVGTGSSQLFQAALFALSTADADAEQEQPMNVVSAIPHYSLYPTISNFLKSGLYQWAGDADTYDKDEPYIEVVCSPNNPDGVLKEPAVAMADKIEQMGITLETNLKVVLGISSFLIEPMCQRMGSRQVWAPSNFTVFACMASIAIISLFSVEGYSVGIQHAMSQNKAIKIAALAVFSILGFPLAINYSVPFSVTSELTADSGGGQGLAIGVLNLAIVVPQMIISLGAGPWDAFFGGGNIPAFVLASICAFVGGVVAVLKLPKLSSVVNPFGSLEHKCCYIVQ